MTLFPGIPVGMASQDPLAGEALLFLVGSQVMPSLWGETCKLSRPRSSLAWGPWAGVVQLAGRVKWLTNSPSAGTNRNLP